MNNYDELLFNGRMKKQSKNNKILSTDSINNYRNLDVSDHPNFKTNMKKHRKRIFELLKTMMYSNEKKHKNDDETDIITMKFIELCDEIILHFENLAKISEVNEQFSILSKLDKVLLSNNSS